MIKVLHVTSSLDAGGIASLLFDYSSRMMDEYSFDFILTSETKGFLEEKFIQMGCRVFHIPQLRKAFIGHTKQLKEIIKNGNYDVVHDHGDFRSYFTLKYAKRYKVKKRISHCHLAYVPESMAQYAVRKFFGFLVKRKATNLFACSYDAGKWMWSSSNFFVMKNSIECEKFIFDSKKREITRENWAIDKDIFVIGCVGRLTQQKNPQFLAKIFKEYTNYNSNSRLVYIGDGELMNETKAYCDALEISDKVIFMGIRPDVCDLIQGFDCFVLPSRYEGLGMVYVEAQINGLLTIGTLERVPKDAKISDNMIFVSERCSAKAWAETILNNRCDRNGNGFDDAVKAGYAIEVAVSNLKKEYSK